MRNQNQNQSNPIVSALASFQRNSETTAVSRVDLGGFPQSFYLYSVSQYIYSVQSVVQSRINKKKYFLIFYILSIPVGTEDISGTNIVNKSNITQLESPRGPDTPKNGPPTPVRFSKLANDVSSNMVQEEIRSRGGPWIQTNTNTKGNTEIVQTNTVFVKFTPVIELRSYYIY